MSTATAGKVLLLPKGEYSATTQYKVLDWVLYQGRPYVAKQTTTGNAPIYEPTQANPDNYWQLLLDFPTVVDNVPTQNSNNLVKSGGVYSSLADKVKTDGSNASVFSFGGSEGSNFYYNSLSKDAGSNEDVTMVMARLTTALPYTADVSFFEANIGNEFTALITGLGNTIVIIDSVSDNGTNAVVTGHLKVDNTAAISDSGGYGSLKNYTDGDKVVFIGDGLAADGDEKLLIGTHNAVNISDYPGIAIGDTNIVDNRYGVAIGLRNYAHGINAFVVGRQNIANQDYQTVVGYHNNNKQDTIFEVGGGAFTSNSGENAFEVYPDGLISMDDGNTQFKFTVYNGKPGYYDASYVFHPFEEPLKLVNNSVVLSTSQDTTVTFSNAAITDDSTIEVFTNVYTIVPTDVVVPSGGGSVTVTFAKVSSATTIKVKVEVRN